MPPVPAEPAVPAGRPAGGATASPESRGTPTPPGLPAPLGLPTPLGRGACPRCGAPALFAGLGRLAESCPACGLDFRRWESGPRLIGGLALAVTLLLLGLALGVDRLFQPPLWTILLWGPLSALVLLATLHGAKGVLLVRRYRAAVRAGQAP